jgi:hypothetical protein
MEPNLAESIYIRSSIKFLLFVPFRQQIWLPREIKKKNVVWKGKLSDMGLKGKKLMTTPDG